MHRATKPLLADENGLPVYSKGYALCSLVAAYTNLTLDQWQADLIVRVLEQCPPGHEREGHLRYRQVVISIPRQAGKSVIASVLALFGLLQHVEAPKVLGIARNGQQAGIVYNYTAEHVNGSEALRALLKCAGTPRIGINARGPQSGSYVVLAGDKDAMQGYPSTFAIADELHVLKPDKWDAIVTSQRAQEEPLLVGITTAGDLNSTLLKRLYKQGQEALDGKTESFGFFEWSSDSEELTPEAIADAHPAVQCGRLDAQTIYEDERHTPKANWQRFVLNKFYDGTSEPWMPMEHWTNCAGSGLTDFKDAVYAIDVSANWTYASVVAAKKIDGIIHTALVARIVNPDMDRLKGVITRLRKAGRCTFVVGGQRLNALVDFCQSKNWAVERINSNAAATSMVYGLVSRERVNHDGNGYVTAQHSSAKTKSHGDGFVLQRGTTDIDACYASLYAIFYAEIAKPAPGVMVA